MNTAHDRRPRAIVYLALAPGLLLMLAPKCPLCIAAYLSFFGMGAATLLAPWLRPVAFAVMVLSTATLLFRFVTSRYGCARKRKGMSCAPIPEATKT